MSFIRMLEGNGGRITRGAVGAALVGVGAWLGGGWWALTAVGLVPLAAGLSGVCLAAPLAGDPLRRASTST